MTLLALLRRLLRRTPPATEAARDQPGEFSSLTDD